MTYSAERYAALFAVDPEAPLLGEDTTTPWRERLGHRAVACYRVKRTDAGDMRTYQGFPVWIRREDAGRARRSRPTGAAQLLENRKNALETLIGKVHANFTGEDLCLCLTYAGRQPETLEEARRDVQAYIRRLRRYRERNGLSELKYIYVLESLDADGRKKRVHLHMIMSGMDRDEAERLWGLGRANSRRLTPDDFGLEGLTHYIVKSPRAWANKKRWCCSKGLKKPKVTRADRRFSKRDVERLAADHNSLREKILKQNPGYAINDISIKYSDYVPGAYITVRMRRVGGPPAGALLRMEEALGGVIDATKCDRPRARARARNGARRAAWIEGRKAAGRGGQVRVTCIR